MKCLTCPAAGDHDARCLGESVPRLCELARTRQDYRKELFRLARPGPHRPFVTVADALGVVSRCPSRGGSLPASEQPDCGCFELTACRAGRGARPGLVTLQDCLACVTAGGA